MQRKLKLTAVVGGIAFMALSFAGCALLPYSSNYSCPEAKSDMGNCSSLTANYKASLHPKEYAKLEDLKKKKSNCPVSLKGTKACSEYSDGSSNIKTVKPNVSGISVSDYLLKYMLKSSTTPLYVPATVKKIWILPYSSNNTFHGGQDIFVVVKRGKWLYGNYLFKKYGGLNLFKIRR